MRCLSVVALLVTALLHSATSHAQDQLLVDFGGGGLEPGYRPFGETGQGVSSTTCTFSSSMGTAGTIAATLSVTPVADHLQWRVRASAGSPWPRKELLIDFVWVAWASLHLQLNTLVAGNYTMTTYHHDTEWADHGAVNIVVEDAGGIRTAAANIEQTTGTFPTRIAAVSFNVVADGVNPITAHFDAVSGNGPVLNGFDLVPSLPIGVAGSTWTAIKRLYRE